MSPMNYNFLGSMPWMQQPWAQQPNTFTGSDANGTFQGGGMPAKNPTPTWNYAPGQIPGAGAQMPSTPTYGTPQTQTGAPGGGGDNPFLTNATKQGLGTAMGLFDPQWYNNLSNQLYSQANQNLFENVIPGINQASQQAGQYGGGSRNAIAQGIAMRGMNDSVMRAMAPQYAQGYEASMNRNLQGAGTALQGLLGLGNLDVNRMNAETNAASATANAAGAPQYSNPMASGLGAMMSLLPFLSGTWGNSKSVP